MLLCFNRNLRFGKQWQHTAKKVVCQVADFVGTVHTFSSARAMAALRLALALRAGAAASASFKRTAIQSLSPPLANWVNIALTSWGASSIPGCSATAVTQQLMSTDKTLAFSVYSQRCVAAALYSLACKCRAEASNYRLVTSCCKTTSMDLNHACIHLANERFVGSVRTQRLQCQVLIFRFWLASQ